MRRAPDADVERHARLDCVSHLLDRSDYEDPTPGPTESPERQDDAGHESTPAEVRNRVRVRFGSTPTDDGDGS